MKLLLVFLLALVIACIINNESFAQKSTYFDSVKFIQYLDENTAPQNCDDHQCPEGKNVMMTTNADGTVECSCFDGGNAVRAIGYGLGAIALAGVATTGLLIYGAYRIIRG